MSEDTAFMCAFGPFVFVLGLMVLAEIVEMLKSIRGKAAIKERDGVTP